MPPVAIWVAFVVKRRLLAPVSNGGQRSRRPEKLNGRICQFARKTSACVRLSATYCLDRGNIGQPIRWCLANWFFGQSNRDQKVFQAVQSDQTAGVLQFQESVRVLCKRLHKELPPVKDGCFDQLLEALDSEDGSGRSRRPR